MTDSTEYATDTGKPVVELPIEQKAALKLKAWRLGKNHMREFLKGDHASIIEHEVMNRKTPPEKLTVFRETEG